MEGMNVGVNTRVFLTDAGILIALIFALLPPLQKPRSSHALPFISPPRSRPRPRKSLLSPPRPPPHLPLTQAMQSHAEVIFSSDVKNMDEWARRTCIPLTTADALGATYARAHRWLQALRLRLIRDHNWADAPVSDPRMLFSLETSSIWRSSVGLPAGPQLKLHLPLHASSFFSPERRVQWQMVFHSDIFESVRKICPPINDIFSLIQCLLTGVVTLVFEENLPEGVHRTTRGLPHVTWIIENEAALTEIFGISHYRALRRACCDTKAAYKLEVIPYLH